MKDNKIERILDAIPKDLWPTLFEEVKSEIATQEFTKKFENPTEQEIKAITDRIIR